jgi:hypothetical protein
MSLPLPEIGFRDLCQTVRTRPNGAMRTKRTLNLLYLLYHIG